MRRYVIDPKGRTPTSRLGLFVFAPILVSSLLIPASRPIANSTMDSEAERIVLREIQPMVPADGSGGVAAAIHIAGHTRFFNEGFADRSNERSIASDSLFNVASVRKLIEATLVAQGVLRGELRLDDPVNKYVGELQGAYIRRVTIGELATHTSGLLLPTDHPPWPDDSYPFARFIDTLNTWAPPGGVAPGKQRIYSHAGYVLLQVALERRYGAPISALIDSRILKPLGMSSTLIPERGSDNRAIMSRQLMRRTVQGYAADGKAIGPPGNQQSYYDFPGTGQMFSSAQDLARFVSASLGEGSIEPQLRDALLMTQGEAFRVNAQYAQAMAWEINNMQGLTILDKPGGLNNVSAYMGLVPERHLGLVILSNRGDIHPYEAARNTILPDLAKL